jgi:peroxiredoxin
MEENQMRRRTLLFGTLLLLAIGLTVAGCGGNESGEMEQSSGSSAVTENPTETVGDESPTGTAVGQYPPDFSLADLDDNVVTLADFEGKVLIIDLWATWCPPCREEIPFLVDLYEEHKDNGLVVVGIGLDQGGAGALKPFVEKNGVTYPILVGDRAVGQSYGASSIPTTYIIGRDGRIVARHVGFHPSIGAEMRETVEGLLTPAEA